MTGPLREPAPAALDGLSKAALLAYAAAHSVTGVSGSMRKADILAAIKGV